MKIVDLRIMRGPNFWSVRHPKIIVMRLDMEGQHDTLTNTIEGLPERLEKMFPGMYSHRSSEGREGGFFKLVRQGVLLTHVVEHIALEIQTLGGMNCGFGRTQPSSDKKEQYVIFSYQEEKAGEYAARAAVRIAEALISGKRYNLKKDIDALHDIREYEHIGPSTSALVAEAVSRGIPFIRLTKGSLIQLGYGVNQRRIQATTTNYTPAFAADLASNKNRTKAMLEEAGVPVPSGVLVSSIEELKKNTAKVGYPMVIKPLDGNQGRGATINITNWSGALAAFQVARKISDRVIAEKYIVGEDYRLLVVNGKFVAAAKRTPAAIRGDGKLSIKQLVEKVNKDPRRGVGHEKVLTLIEIDKQSRAILKDRGLTLNSVLPDGEVLYLKTTANLSTGGTSTDVTDLVDPYNVLMAERIAGIIGLDICGIDVVTTDIAIPLNEANGAVIEVNAAPGFRMHTSPTTGLARNVAEPVIDMLFPKGSQSTIPIIAITGTNGKTTTTRLIAHMVKSAGYKVGYTTSDGIYIQDRLLQEGDTTGSRSAEFVLKDPTVNFAVLECARGGMLRSGLAFRHCNVGIVTNVSSDHLGMKDINTLEDMAQVKAVIPKTVMPEGYAILNADDELVYKMGHEVDCKVAYFSMDENNPRILRHISRGGIAAVYEDGYISIFKNTYKIRLDRAADIPLTLGGRAKFNIENVLASVLAVYVSGFPVEDIKTALRTFIPSPSKTPGRMNLFKFPTFEVLIDYAHNPAGLRALGDFLNNVEANSKVGVIAAVGDRRNEDIIELGAVAAALFDEIIVREDADTRGRDRDELFELTVQGIQSVKDIEVKRIPDEMAAIAYALENAEKGSFITIISEDIPEAIKLVENFRVIQDRRVMID